MLLPLLIAAAVGYVLGAIPFGYLVARSHGINIFEHGSKNPGATNVRRVLGKGPGNLVFLLDAAKGAVATAWPLFAGRLGVVPFTAERATETAVAGLGAALLGHSFSCFTRFRGGKGVATSVGGFSVLLPIPLLVAAVVWMALFFSTRYVSLASILASIAIPIVAAARHESRLLFVLSLAVALLILLRHRTNLVRLCNGTEPKFAKKPPAT